MQRSFSRALFSSDVDVQGDRHMLLMEVADLSGL